MNCSIKKALLAVFVSAVLYGCGGAPLPDLYYPPPPDVPRIKYITSYRGTPDVSRSSLAADIVLGAQEGIFINKPLGVHVDKDGRIYVTDTANSDILIFDFSKKKLDTVSTMNEGRILSKPVGVATDPSGRMFVTDSQSDKVLVLGKDGKTIAQLFPATPFKQPTGVTVDAERKRIYVSDTHTHNIRVFDLDTLKETRTIGKRGKEEGEFNFPSHIALDVKGNLYVVDTMNGRVQIFDPEGKFIRTFGQFGDVPGMFARPKGVGVDSEGHIYVVDAAFNNVQIFDEEGRILMAFGSYGDGRGEMILPAGLTVDKEDYIYVIDSWGRRVEVFEYLGDKHKAREEKEKTKKK